MRFFFVLLLISPLLLFGQIVEISDSTAKPVLIFDNDRLIEAGSKKVFATVKGNTVFEGESDDIKDIVLLVSTENIFSRKQTGYGLNATQDEALFIIHSGGFFHKNAKSYSDEGMLAYYIKEDDDSLVLYKHSSDTVLCKVPPGLSTGKQVAVFFYFLRKLELEKQVEKQIQKTTQLPASNDGRTTYGSISRLWNTGLDEFVWDGQVFKRKWSSFDYEEWTFDGTTLKRLWYPGDEEFVWDGEILRRKWYPSNDEFEWNGTILRRRFGSPADEFIIQGNIVKRYFGGSSEDEWQIEGDLPVPLIALVVFGLLRK